MGKGRRDFCQLCWRWISNGNFYKHRACLHLWCDHCRAPLWDTYHATRRHMSESQTCAASARCMRCHASWATICRDTDGKPDKHIETCTGRKIDASQEKRACAYLCGRWLLGSQDAQRHTKDCELKMGKKRGGGQNVPGSPGLDADGERIRRELEACSVDLPREYDLVKAAVRDEFGGDSGFPLALPAERMVAVYQRFAEDIKNARETMKEMMEKHKPHKDSQMTLDHESYTGILAAAGVGTPLTAGEYLERLPKTHGGPDGFHPGDWVVCTKRQAPILLAAHHPVRPILVLEGVDDPMSEEVCMRRLERQVDYEIHDLTRKNPGKRAGESTATMDPSKMPIKTFLAVKESRDRPLNMLSLPPFREAMPSFLDLPDYDVINSCIPEQGRFGKHPTDKVRDCARFGLCALGGAMSVWHMDQHGFTTAALCECGRKLWMLLPGMPLARCAEYARQMQENRDKYVGPDWPVVGVPMRARDVLIQPEGTLHAPYSVSWPVVMSGKMLWTQRGVLNATRVMNLEVRENASNEDPEEGVVDKLQCVEQSWARALKEKEKEKKKKGALWLGEDQLGMFRVEVAKLQEALREQAENLTTGDEGDGISLAWLLQKAQRDLAAARAENKKLRRAAEETKRLRGENERQEAELSRYREKEASRREERAKRRKKD
ncbi:hypothetical protein NKR19_g3435 [Coniochaeta hoffmannii]|uniref:JmjC domain-containing protein n=1 Tax=Coniochaeta hoffmannii TaxID=91930 RepID=A0AA38W1F6_9PEZI|nr:hypothetical protein NKR19_g3435 [Coniochaeta hoffmannii]